MEMKSHKTLLLLGIPIILVILGAMLCIIPYYLLGYGCILGCAPARNFTAYDLAILPDLLPVNASPIILRPGRGTIGAVEEVSGDSNGLAVYIVKRFDSIGKATQWYSARIQSKRYTSPFDSPEIAAQITAFQSSNADEYRVTCGNLSADSRCIFEARYQEYYVFFWASIGEGKFTQMDFIAVITYIDRRFGELLGNQ
jgi:hypothetical protein